MLQTLPDEVRPSRRRGCKKLTAPGPQVAFIWPSPLTPVKVIFLANKYLVLVDTALSIVCTCHW